MQSCLQEIGLAQYIPTFQDHGFEAWHDLVHVTESDLEQIGMLLGHRRKLQRAIRLSCSREMPTSLTAPSNSQQHRQRRRYRRHPKRDPNAPRRPKSAYQLFADSIPRQTQDTNITFVEHARLVGSRWALQSAAERSLWTSAASKAKMQFQAQSRVYRETLDYSKYEEYLQNFKTQHNTSNQVRKSLEVRNEEIYEPPADTADDINSQRWGMTSRCATESDTQTDSEQTLLSDVDQCSEHSSAALTLRAEHTTRIREVSPCACGDDTIKDMNTFRPTATSQLQRSQFFRTVLQT